MATRTSRAKRAVAPPLEEDPRVLLLRRHWELASVLHFLQVFEPVIEGDLGLSAEEIETALISNNHDLARIHIALLEGIPPDNTNLKVDDGWIIATANKLSDWWSWVAEGANPFRTNPGKEVQTYKQQDPMKRLFILKALCEVRSEQNDAVWYVNDEMKKGVDISYFRKGKLGSGSNGTTYWYDGDSTIGHRLYSEDVTVDFKQNWKGKRGRLTKSVINIHWETIATNLDDFLEISEKLHSKGRAESAIGELLKTEIVPAVEKLQKRRERDLKRRQKKDELLAFANGFQTRSLRERRPVNYTYSDYDRSINEAIKAEEAIKAATKAKKKDSHEAGKKEKHVSHQGDKGANGGSDISPEHNEDGGQEDAKYLDDLSSDDDEETDAYDPHKGNLEVEGAVVTRKTCLAARVFDGKIRRGLRRSQRNMTNCEEIMHPGQLSPQAMTKKTLRQSPTPISKQFSLSCSEDDLPLTLQTLRRNPIQRNMKNCEEIMHRGQLSPQAMTQKTLRQSPTPISKQFSLSCSEDDLALTLQTLRRNLIHLT